MSQTPIRAVLFDLDGTLVDTLPDIAAAMNAALGEFNLHALDTGMIATLIGKGARELARQVLDEQPTLRAEARARLVDPLFDAYIRQYAPRVGQRGRLFPGVIDGLRALAASGLQLAVVTNAVQHVAEAILQRFDIAPYLHSVVGGIPSRRGKPHPQPLWDACRLLGVSPEAALMVGDSDNDVIAARAAGCAVVCVPYGYNGGQPASALDCDLVADFTFIPAWIQAHRNFPAPVIATSEP